MRECLIVAGDFRRTGGMDRANHALASYLASRGVRVELVAHSVSEDLLQLPGVRWTLVPRPVGHIVGAPLLDMMGRRRALRVSARGGRVVVNGGNCPWADVNWVHMVHAAYTPFCPAAGLGLSLRITLSAALDRSRERSALRAARLVIANSERTRRDLVGLLGVDPARVKVVWLGVDPAEFAPTSDGARTLARSRLGIRRERVVVAFVGSHGPELKKGFDTLLRAWSELTKQRSDLLLVTAGEGWLARWQKAVVRAGLSSSIRFLGHTTRVRDLIASADLLVAPSRYDAYGLAVHEALCSGVPALTSSAAGIAERYPHELSALLLRDPESWEELAGRIQRCLSEARALKEGVLRFGESLRTWTWADMSAAMVQAIADADPQARQ